MRCSARPSACRRAQAGLFHQDQIDRSPRHSRREDQGRSGAGGELPGRGQGSGPTRTVPMPTRNASRSLSCSAMARGPWSGNTRRARWSTAAMSASSGPTMNIPAARIPTVRPTRSCGTGQRANASASVRSSPKQPTTARRMKAMRQGVIASLEAEKKKRGAEGTGCQRHRSHRAKACSRSGRSRWRHRPRQGKSSGLTFHYSPYAVGSYAEGEYVAFVPWETLKPYLTPEGVKIFGGARPKDDEDRQQ